jgi:hypothetical protein
MNKNDMELRLPRTMQRAIAELEGLIVSHFPEARFQVERSPESARIVHLTTTVDVPDLDLVIDTVIDRMLELQTEERVPIYVIPVRPRRSPVDSDQADHSPTGLRLSGH